jgi:hypothetical protein
MRLLVELRKHVLNDKFTAVFDGVSVSQLNVEFVPVSVTNASEISFVSLFSWVNSQSRNSCTCHHRSSRWRSAGVTSCVL